ncbi:MAG: DUF4363 family protein [Bacillota bacterium]|nr:DUF4363 family protein [Bacillota bacterium]
MISSDKIKKAAAYLIPLLILIIFTLILTSGFFLKKTFEAGTTIPQTLEKLELIIVGESWGEAEVMVDSLQHQWDTLAPYLQISTTESDIKDFSKSITSLKGYIRGEELGSALAELGLLNYIWEQFEY